MAQGGNNQNQQHHGQGRPLRSGIAPATPAAHTSTTESGPIYHGGGSSTGRIEGEPVEHTQRPTRR